VAVTAARLWLAAAFLAAGIFTAFPGLDLWFTGLFWSPEGGFYLHDWPPFRWAYVALPTLSWAIIVALLVLLAFAILARRCLGPFDRPRILFLLLSFAIGPGLLANTVLKDHWGRARPSQVVEFGGDKSFTPALLPSGQCDRNCSFVSGHAAMAFALIGFAFLPATRRRRWPAAAAALAFGCFVGVARIAQGGHFLSDTVFAALLVTGTAWLLYRFVVVGHGLDPPVLGRTTLALSRAAGTLARSLAERRWWPWLMFDLGCLAAIAAADLWLDRPLARYFQAGDDRLGSWFRRISDLGLGWGWLLLSGGFAILLFLLARTQHLAPWRARFTSRALAAGFVFVSVASSGLAADIVKILVGRTRPKLWALDGSFAWTGLAWRSDHWSFPSGHVANATGLALALYFLWPRHAAAYALFVALIALARIGAAQHYLGDTIGSVWIAVLVTCYVRGVFRRGGLAPALPGDGIIPPAPAPSWRRLLAPWPEGNP
jgi:lipid A 4'-phosphatase